MSDLLPDALATLAESFWTKVQRGDDCWPYGAGAGYGKFRGMPAHRAAWILTNGRVPPGLFVLHHCDNPPCVRPDHLFLGTQTDNMRDASQKGRLAPARTLTLVEAAASLGVAPSTLRHQTKNGKFDAFKIGRDWFVAPEEVARYAATSLRRKDGALLRLAGLVR